MNSVSTAPVYDRALPDPALPPGEDVWQLVERIIGNWQRGAPADARAALSAHGELRADRGAAFDLAYYEFVQRREAGEVLDPVQFCARFPTLQDSLLRCIAVDQHVGAHPHLLDEITWPKAGDEFLGFVLRQPLGNGGFARVFLATVPALGGRAVVVKLAPRGGGEAETLGRLSHPNVVPIHSVSVDPDTGLTAICMPYLGGTTLCHVLQAAFSPPGPPRQGRIVLEAALKAGAVHPAKIRVQRRGTYLNAILHLAAQLADGLAYIHQEGIHHCDLKPSNVLISPDGTPMLLDFNLAQGGTGTANRQGGTVPYMAPEQLRALAAGGADGPLPDARADLFAMGVILYELLAGAHPFGPIPEGLTNELPRTLLERQRRGPQPLQRLNREVDRPLAQLVERCLAFDPSARPQTAAALAASLRKELTLLRRGRRWACVHPWLAAGVLVLALVFGGAVAFGFPAVLAQVEHAETRAKAGALFARGREHQRQGNYDLALADYRSADLLAADGKTKACIAYCLNRTNAPRSAVVLYEAALAADYRVAEVYNNLGYTRLHLKEWDAAHKDLDRAVERNPALQAARHNRAVLFWRKASRVQGENPQLAADYAEDGIADIREAIKTGPPTAELHYHAACLCAHGVGKKEERIQLVFEHLKRAIHFGHAAKLLKKDPAFRPLQGDARFKELEEQTAGGQPAPYARLLLDPVLEGTSAQSGGKK